MLNKRQLNRLAVKHLNIAILPVVFVLIVIVMTILTSGNFLTIPNISSIFFQLPELGLFSLAIMISMITGGIDLSIISTANFTGVLMAFLMKTIMPAETIGGEPSSHMLLLILAVGIMFSLLLGAINGICIAYVGITPILTTLGTMVLYEGLTLAITKGYVISSFPRVFQYIGGASIVHIPVPFIIFLVFAIALHILLTKRPLGTYFFMIGSNKNATEYSGINVKLVLLKAYMLSGLYAGIAGIIMISRFNSANARYGSSYLLLSALLSIMGGTNPEGGFGNVFGVVLALLTLQSLTSGFNLLGISSFVTIALWGILLISVIFYRQKAESITRTILKRAHA